MELTRERAIEEHRKMWRWLAEHPEKKKWDYLLDETPILNDLINIRNMCFLCTYTKEDCNRSGECEDCEFLKEYYKAGGRHD